MTANEKFVTGKFVVNLGEIGDRRITTITFLFATNSRPRRSNRLGASSALPHSNFEESPTGPSGRTRLNPWWCAMCTDESLSWWDRDVDSEGKPIRADVRSAARDLWDYACEQARTFLGDASEAPELMETVPTKASIKGTYQESTGVAFK